MRRNILIACEDNLWLRSCWTQFRGGDYHVETTKSVSELVRKVRDDSSRVVLLDEEVEGVKAFDLVPLLKRMDGIVQVIVMSSDGCLRSVRRLRSAGIFYQVMKPVDMMELASAVECAFEKINREHPLLEGFCRLFVPDPILV